MTTNFPLPGILVDPQGQTVSVTILSEPSGVAPTIYLDPYGVTQVVLPLKIQTGTKFYVATEGIFNVNGQLVTLEGRELATVQIPTRYVSALNVGDGGPAAPLPYLNVNDYGAVPDGVIVQTVWSTSGTTLTWTGGSFAPTDVGKAIGIQQAGPANAFLITTIASYVSSAQVTLAASASTVSNVSGVYGTDNTAAFTATAAAMNSQSAGEVRFGSGIYVTTAPVTWPASANSTGFRLIGTGGGGNATFSRIGTTIFPLMNTTLTGGNFSNGFLLLGNTNSCVVEGLGFLGIQIFTSVGQAPAFTGSTATSNSGATYTALFGYFCNALVVRDVTVYGFSAGMWFLGCHELLLETGEISGCRDYGLVLVSCAGTIQLPSFTSHNNGTGAGSGETVCNVAIDGYNTSNPTIGATIFCGIQDELGDTTSLTACKTVYFGSVLDCSIGGGQLYGPDNTASGRSNRYGIHVSANSVRTTIHDLMIEPYLIDSTHMCTNTIKIDSGATGTVLQNVTTNPNSANGGGDISDSGTNTVYINVRPNGGPAINTIQTKAGIPADGDWDNAPPIGTTVLDTTDGKIYYRTASATWKAATLT